MESQTMQDATDADLSNADVFDATEEGMKLMHDGIKQPLTVTAGVTDYMAEHGEKPAIVMLEGPQGGQKMMTQNKHDPDRIAIDSFSRSSNGEWVSNLRIVEQP